MRAVPAGVLADLAREYHSTTEQWAQFAGGDPHSDGTLYRFLVCGRPHLVKVIELVAGDSYAQRRAAERVAFLAHLAERGVPVPAIIPTRHGAPWVVAEDLDGRFFAYAMPHLDGTPFAGVPTSELPAFYEAWGATVGAQHAATSDYRLWNGIAVLNRPRPLLHWQEEMDLFAGWLADSEVRALWQELRAELAELPESREFMGFVHNDAHAHNFLLEPASGRAVALDFDVATCHFLVTDIATALYTQCDHTGRPFADSVLDRFLVPFVNGYRGHWQLPPGWAQQLPLLMRYRDILVLCVFSNGLAGEQPPMVRAWREAVVARTPLLSPAALERLEGIAG